MEAGSGSGSGTTVVEKEDFKIGADEDEVEEGIETELRDAEVKEWARRVSGDELKTVDISGKGKEGEGS